MAYTRYSIYAVARKNGSAISLTVLNSKSIATPLAVFAMLCVVIIVHKAVCSYFVFVRNWNKVSKMSFIRGHSLRCLHATVSVAINLLTVVRTYPAVSVFRGKAREFMMGRDLGRGV